MNATMLGTIKRGYAATAQGVGRVLERLGILDEEPPPRQHRLRHWAYSLTRAHDSLGIAELDVPWWTYGAIDEVERWLASREGDVRAFEWGSGASTIWLAKRVAEVRSVEHHAEFGAMIQRQLATYANATLDIVEPVPSASPAIGSAKEGHGGLDFTDYVEHIDAVGGTFGLIVVDGRAREACLTKAVGHLQPDGIIVFDNTMRRRYRRAIEAAPVVERRHRGLTPTLPYPDQTSILTRDDRDR
jgi:predicted O-methyltransferase YrrM